MSETDQSANQESSGRRPLPHRVEEGGDPPCWAQLVCPECGALETDKHREGCSQAAAGEDCKVTREA